MDSTLLTLTSVGALAGGIGTGLAASWARRALRRIKSLDGDLRATRDELSHLRRRFYSEDATNRLAAAGREPKLPIEFRSEFGEDALLWDLFGGKLSGYFIEVGAFDGYNLSVTYAFESVGWTGLLVEAIPERAAACAARRPHSRVVHAALGPKGSSGTATFSVAEGVEALSYLSTTARHEKHVRELNGRVRQVTVPLTSFDALLADHTGIIDVASIDVEGFETSVLEGFDLARLRPRVLLIEDLTGGRQPALDTMLDRAGYVMAGWFGYNQVRVRSDETDILARARERTSRRLLPSLLR